MTGNVMLQFPPCTFNGIEIRTTGRCWPPVDALFLIEVFGNPTSVFGIIILHETIFGAPKLFLKKGKQMLLQDLGVQHTVHYLVKNTCWWPLS